MNLTGVFSILAAANPSSSDPAGGAAFDQILIANAMAIGASLVLGWLVLGHREGKRDHLARAAAWTEKVSGLPGWAALPTLVSAISLFTALFGMYWDISLHIDVGRDAGPLANPAHYFILAGLFGIFSAGFLAMALPLEDPGPTSVRINDGWRAPLGGVLVTGCGFFALLGFPLDDIWHRLFGQDVTLWGPTHLMLIGGASMTLVGMSVLLVEGMRARKRSGGPGDESPSLFVRFRRTGLMGGFLIGLSTFQAEFDFGVPQFQMIFQPMMIAFAAATALVCGRLWIGRGGALMTAVFYLAVRGGITLLVGPVLGETTPALPLYLVEAACVEIAALYLVRRPYALGAVSGLAIGTIGFAAEYAWTNAVFPIPWNEALLPAGLVLATLAGLAGGPVGASVALSLRGELPATRAVRAIPAVALVAVGLLIANGLITTDPPSGSRADVRLADAPGATAPGDPGREVQATVRLQPADLGDDARWLNVTAWQGGGLVISPLHRVGEGIYRTEDPIPVHGDWKAMIRLQKDRTIASVPIYLPRDAAIPAPGVPATATFVRGFRDDKEVLQREQKSGVPAWIKTVAPLVVLAIALSLLSLLAFGLARLADGEEPRPEVPSTTRRAAARLATWRHGEPG